MKRLLRPEIAATAPESSAADSSALTVVVPMAMTRRLSAKAREICAALSYGIEKNSCSKRWRRMSSSLTGVNVPGPT